MKPFPFSWFRYFQAFCVCPGPVIATASQGPQITGGCLLGCLKGELHSSYSQSTTRSQTKRLGGPVDGVFSGQEASGPLVASALNLYTFRFVKDGILKANGGPVEAHSQGPHRTAPKHTTQASTIHSPQGSTSAVPTALCCLLL